VCREEVKASQGGDLVERISNRRSGEWGRAPPDPEGEVKGAMK